MGKVRVGSAGGETVDEEIHTTAGENVSSVFVPHLPLTPSAHQLCVFNQPSVIGGVPQGGPGWGVPGGGGGGAGRGGGDGSEGGVERLHDIQLQQQIMVALRRLREDMRSVMERLEVVERLAATHVRLSAARTHTHTHHQAGATGMNEVISCFLSDRSMDRGERVFSVQLHARRSGRLRSTC